MMIGTEWREPGGYDALRASGRAGLAWELLRRYPAYRSAQPDTGGNQRQFMLERASPDDIARWGLHFRRG